MPKDRLPPALRELADAIDVHRARLRSLMDRGVGGLSELYRDFYGDLVQRLGEIEHGGRGATMTGFQMKAILAQVEDAIAGFNGDFAAHLADVGADAQVFATEELTDELKALAPDFRAAAVPLRIEEIATFKGVIQGVESSLLRRYHLQSMSYSLDAIQAVENELARGLVLGRTLQENMDAVQPVIRGTEYQAERIVRTELTEASARTSQAAMAQLAGDVPGLQQQWYTVGEPRAGRANTGLECPVCGPMHGLVRPMGKAFRRYRGREIVKPPAHPNCLCVVTPWHASWSKAEAQAVADKVA